MDNEQIPQNIPKIQYQIGDTVGQYEIINVLGHGGMGKVFLTRHTILGHLRALKILHQDLKSSRRATERFLREARIGATLTHPNIPEVYDVWADKDHVCIVMEYIKGKSLMTMHWRQPAIYIRQLLKQFEEIIDVLAAAHEQNIIHRDIKPQNVIIDTEGNAKVIDFGIAQIVDPNQDAENMKLIKQGRLLGTPACMAPELLKMQSIANVSTDIYSIGTLLYFCLTGRFPYLGRSVHEILMQMESPPPAINSKRKNNPIPKRLEEIVLKAIELDPSNRYANTRDLQNDLNALAKILPEDDTAQINKQRAEDIEFSISDTIEPVINDTSSLQTAFHTLSPAKSQPYIYMFSPETGVQFVYLTKGSFIIGRDESSDIQILNRSVSRKHATLQQTRSGWILKDEDSTYGTIVNGNKIRQAFLHPGDWVQIASCVMEFRLKQFQSQKDANSYLIDMYLQGFGEPPTSMRIRWRSVLKQDIDEHDRRNLKPAGPGGLIVTLPIQIKAEELILIRIAWPTGSKRVYFAEPAHWVTTEGELDKVVLSLFEADKSILQNDNSEIWQFLS